MRDSSGGAPAGSRWLERLACGVLLLGCLAGVLLAPAKAVAAGIYAVQASSSGSGAPVTTASLSPATPGTSGWFTVAPEITLTAVGAEGSSIAIRYGWGIDPPATLYSTKFTASSGRNTLYYRATDGAGNAETVQSLVFKVDTSITPPEATAPTGVESDPTLVRGTIDYTATASDSLSGVDYVGFFLYGQLESGEWNAVGARVGELQTPPEPDTGIYGVSWNTALVADGFYKLQAQLADVAGNTAFSPAQYVLVDNHGPAVSLSNPMANDRISGTGYAIVGTAADPNLKTWTLQMRAVGDSTWNDLTSGTSAVTDSTFFMLDTTAYDPGQYEFQLVATDTAGNSSTPDLRTPVTIDNVRPHGGVRHGGEPEHRQRRVLRRSGAGDHRQDVLHDPGTDSIGRYSPGRQEDAGCDDVRARPMERATRSS